MTTLVCKIPDQLDARLEALAQRARLPKTKIVRKVLEQAVGRRPRRVAAHDLVNNIQI
jgi:predicted transcriptional regulator